MRILVIGAGIGGLATAAALARDGHWVTVIDKAPIPQAHGSGIILAPNAVACLKAIGIDVTIAGWPLHRTSIKATSGAVLAEPSTSVDEFLTYAMARPDLHTRLISSLPPSVDLFFEAGLQILVADDNRVMAHWRGGVGSFDLVVGADGSDSATRQMLFGTQVLRPSGYTAWRGLAHHSAGHEATEYWGATTDGDAARVGIVPIGPETSYYYLYSDTRPETGEPQPEELSRRFAGFPSAVTTLLAGLEESPPLHQEVFELARPHWGRGRVFLVGDAAHAMTPDIGQGAAMAMEDALSLAIALDEGPDGALGRYVAERERRVRRLAKATRRLGRLGHLPTAALRGLALKRLAGGMMAALMPHVAPNKYEAIVRPGIALAEDWRSD